MSNQSEKKKYLNVAERNAMAKYIATVLSEGKYEWREGLSELNKIYECEANVEGQNSLMIMTSTYGHMQKYAFIEEPKWDVDIISLFDRPVGKVYKHKRDNQYEEIVETLKREVKKCDALIIWTDCGLIECENIGYEIIELCQDIKPDIPVYRAIFTEITEASIKHALKMLGSPDRRKIQAVDIRSELDFRISHVFSKYQTDLLQLYFPIILFGKWLPYSTPKFATLAFVVQRYKEFENFIPRTYWQIKVLHTLGGQTVEFNWSKYCLYENLCEAALISCKANPDAIVQNIAMSPAPLTTLELLKRGTQRLNIRSYEIMDCAQKLYEDGLISYPRTRKNFFPLDLNLRDLVEKQVNHDKFGPFAAEILKLNEYFDPSKGSTSDGVHPPIYPIKCGVNLAGNKKLVYDLIVEHFLDCVKNGEELNETTITIKICDEEFVAIVPKNIFTYKEGDIFKPTEITMQSASTVRPEQLKEADLIQLMATNSTGTDSTYAIHIKELESNGYIIFNGGDYIIPQTIGLGLVEGYDAAGSLLAKPNLLKELQDDLNLICSGEKDAGDVLSEHIDKFKEVYETISTEENKKKIVAAVSHRLGANHLNTIKCYCQAPAKLWQVKKQNENCGRYFYNCFLNNCKFFDWVSN